VVWQLQKLPFISTLGFALACAGVVFDFVSVFV
jgi:hypothetical protein